MNALSKELIRLAETIGWTVDGTTDGGHLLLVHPNGSRYFTASTPSDRRGVKNALSDLERMGGQRLVRVNHRRSRKNFAGDDPEVEAARRKHEAAHGERIDREEAERAALLAQERKREAAAQRAAASLRREREIAALMRPGR